MNQKNFEYLRDQVKFTGFGDDLEIQLKENLTRQSPEFTLKHQATFGKDELTSALHFKKSATSDLYFFNSYLSSLKQDHELEKKNQNFYIGKENNITLKEGYNLLSGRSVNKDLVNQEGKTYNAWLKLDFKQTDQAGNFKLQQYHQKYGFELDQALQKYPIKELENASDRGRLFESLKKGNRQSVTFSINGADQKRYIEANPQFKSITVFNSNMQRQRLSNTQTKIQNLEVKAINHKVEKNAENKLSENNEESSKPSKKARKKKQIILSP